MHIALSPTLRKIGTLAAAVGLALGAATQPASAADGDTQTFLLTSDHCTGTCGGGVNPQASFGTIVVTDLAGSALGFHVTLNNGNQFVNTGFPLTFAYNLAGDPTVTYSGLTAGWTIPGGSSPSQNAGTFSMNGTGSFEYGVLWGLQGGGNGTAGPLDFTITGTGLTLASLAQNAGQGDTGPQFFAVDILSGTTGNTGVVDASVALPPTSVPEPETYAMLLAGLGMMGFVARRRKQKAA